MSFFSQANIQVFFHDIRHTHTENFASPTPCTDLSIFSQTNVTFLITADTNAQQAHNAVTVEKVVFRFGVLAVITNKHVTAAR